MKFLRCFFAIAAVGFVPYGVASEAPVALDFKDVLPLTMITSSDKFLSRDTNSKFDGLMIGHFACSYDCLLQSREDSLRMIYNKFRPCGSRGKIVLDRAVVLDFRTRFKHEFSEVTEPVEEAAGLLVGMAHYLKRIAEDAPGIVLLYDLSVPLTIRQPVKNKWIGLPAAAYCLRNEAWLLKQSCLLGEDAYAMVVAEISDPCRGFCSFPLGLSIH